MKEHTIKSIGIMSIATGLSRLLGFVREMFFGYFFGTTPVAAAFLIAFRIPNLFRALLAEGALSSAFIPVFTEYLTKSKEEANKVANIIFNALCVSLIFFVVIGIIFSPFIIQVITINSAQNSYTSLLINLLRIMFPYIIFVSISALFMGILYSYNHFLTPALAPVISNISVIFSYFFTLFDENLEKKVYGLAIGVLVGGLIQVIIQFPILLKKGIKFSPLLILFHPVVKRILKLMSPAVIGLAVMQINMFVDTMLAYKLGSYAVASLNYGNRIMLLPVGLFGVSIANAVFPNMSLCAAKNDLSEFKNNLTTGLKLCFFLMCPCTFAFIILSIPIIRVVFQRGEFGYLSTLASSKALLFYSIGLIAYAGVKVVVCAFYSLKDTLTPIKIGILAMILNIILNLVLMIPLQQGGLALATALASFFNMSTLILILRKRLNGIQGKNILKCLMKIIASSLLLIIFCILVLGNLMQEVSSFVLTIKLMIVICLGIGIYILSAFLFKVEEITIIKKVILNKSRNIDFNTD